MEEGTEKPVLRGWKVPIDSSAAPEETTWHTAGMSQLQDFACNEVDLIEAKSGAVPTKDPGGHHVQGLFHKLNEHGLQVLKKTNF